MVRSTTRCGARIYRRNAPVFRGFRSRGARASARRRSPARADAIRSSYNLTAERGVAVKTDRSDAVACSTLCEPRSAGKEIVKMLDQVGRATNDFFEYAGGVTLLSAESLGFIGAPANPRRAKPSHNARSCGVQSLVDRHAHRALHRDGDFAGIRAAGRGVRRSATSSAARLPTRRCANWGRCSRRSSSPGRVGCGDRRRARLDGRDRTDRGAAFDGLAPARLLVVPRLVALLLMLPLLDDLRRRRLDRRRRCGSRNLRAHRIRLVHLVGASADRHVRRAQRAAQVVRFRGDHRDGRGSYQGLSTRGGAAGVGKSTTGAVVIAIILIFIFNFALSYLLFS